MRRCATQQHKKTEAVIRSGEPMSPLARGAGLAPSAKRKRFDASCRILLATAKQPPVVYSHGVRRWVRVGLVARAPHNHTLFLTAPTVTTSSVEETPPIRSVRSGPGAGYQKKKLRNVEREESLGYRIQATGMNVCLFLF